MIISEDLDLMRTSPLFASCSIDEIVKFLTCNYPSIFSYAKDEVVHEQDVPLEDILLILKGELILEKMDVQGNILVVETLKGGDVYGQATVFGRENKSTMTIRATKASRVARFPKRIFYKSCSAACKSHENVIKNMMALLADQTQNLNKRVDCLATTSLKGKVARYLLQVGKDKKENEAFEIPYNREELALYLGVQRPSLSRTLTQMADEGLISYHRSSFKILDLDALEDFR